MQLFFNRGIFQVCILLFVGMTIFVTSLVHAEIFSYRDRQGVLHFSNAPTTLQYRYHMGESGQAAASGTADADYDDIISEAARRNGLPFDLLKAMIHVESAFNPHAISKKGALGLMQIMPDNLAPLNIENPFDPRDNIMGGASYMKSMINRFDGKLELALAAYNAGPSAVERYSSIPPYQETQEYVQKVMKFSLRYKKI